MHTELECKVRLICNRRYNLFVEWMVLQSDLISTLQGKLFRQLYYK